MDTALILYIIIVTAIRITSYASSKLPQTAKDLLLASLYIEAWIKCLKRIKRQIGKW